MSQIVPLQALANQTAQAQLGGQAVTLNVYQQTFGLYMDVMLGTVPVVQGVICLNKTLIVRNTYLGLIGDLIFLDTQGGGNPISPVYTGIGSRFFLVYLSATDIAALNLPAGVS